MSRPGPGRPPHEPTGEDRERVVTLVAEGVPRHEIAASLGICRDTLRLHYRAELDEGDEALIGKVASRLYREAMDGEGKTAVTAAIFVMKARAGWSDRQVVEHKGDVPFVIVGEPEAASADDWAERHAPKG